MDALAVIDLTICQNVPKDEDRMALKSVGFFFNSSGAGGTSTTAR